VGLRCRIPLRHLPLTDWSTWVGCCTSSPHKGIKYRLCYLDFFGGHKHIPWKTQIKQSKYQSCYLTPCCGLEVQNPTKALKSVKGPCNTFDLNPNWEKILSSFALWISHETLPKDGIVLFHLELKSKILLGPSTDLSAWVGFCTSSPQQGVKYQLWYLDFLGWGLYNTLLCAWCSESHPGTLVS
jgi:hypothetical protein